VNEVVIMTLAGQMGDGVSLVGEISLLLQSDQRRVKVCWPGVVVCRVSTEADVLTEQLRSTAVGEMEDWKRHKRQI
jgi:hypothetical protein